MLLEYILGRRGDLHVWFLTLGNLRSIGLGLRLGLGINFLDSLSETACDRFHEISRVCPRLTDAHGVVIVVCDEHVCGSAGYRPYKVLPPRCSWSSCVGAGNGA